MPAEPASTTGADRGALGSAALASGTIDATSPKFAEGLARVREVTDTDGACSAWAKALYMAAAAAVKGHRGMLMAEMERSRNLGLELVDARGAALTVLISRGEGIYATFNAAIDEVFGDTMAPPSGEAPEFPIDRQGCLDYFEDYFGFVPDYVELMATTPPAHSRATC